MSNDKERYCTQESAIEEKKIVKWVCCQTGMKHVIKVYQWYNNKLILPSMCENNFRMEFGIATLFRTDNCHGSRMELKSYGDWQGEKLDWSSRRTLLIRKQMLKYYWSIKDKKVTYFEKENKVLIKEIERIIGWKI